MLTLHWTWKGNALMLYQDGTFLYNGDPVSKVETVYITNMNVVLSPNGTWKLIQNLVFNYDVCYFMRPFVRHSKIFATS